MRAKVQYPDESGGNQSFDAEVSGSPPPQTSRFRVPVGRPRQGLIVLAELQGVLASLQPDGDVALYRGEPLED